MHSFADRLWWARHKAGLGATRLARMVGCSQSLISSLERNDAGRSKLSDKFAEALKVDRQWLAYGADAKAPKDFDADAARRGRMAMGEAHAGGIDEVKVVRFRNQMSAVAGVSYPPLEGADAMTNKLVSDFMDFARMAGIERAKNFLSVLGQIVAFQETMRQNDVGAADNGHCDTDR